jgi:signal transduction histidine kinase
MDGLEPSPRTPQRPLRTLRGRLTLVATAVVAVVLVASAIGLVLVQRRVLTHGIDEALRQRADNVQAEAARGGALPVEGDPEDSFLQVVDGDGRVLAASVNARGVPAAVPPLEPGEATVLRTVALSAFADGAELRVLGRPLGSGSSRSTLVVAKNLDDVAESVSVLMLSLTLSIPGIVALLGALTWWLTGRALRPVESLRAEVASISGTELARRLPVTTAADEITRLASTMNELLARVEQATARQERFVADASHELRIPLTRIRSELEIGLAHPESVDPAPLHRSLLADVAQLQQLVDDLLLLARSGSGAVPMPRTPVDLDDVVLVEAKRLRERGRVRVDTTGLSAARTRGDRNELARAVRNLASNAERHARNVVAFELREDTAWSELVVRDDGPGIPAEHRTTVFQRFTRLDEARSQDAGGSGLGLAIVQDIVTRHGGTVALTSADGEGARFLVRLPRAE